MKKRPIKSQISPTRTTLNGDAPVVASEHRARLMAAVRVACRGVTARKSSNQPSGGDGTPPSTGAFERRAGAYVLLEIIIALTVFAVVATGLATVLHSSLDSANLLRRQAAIRHGLESLLVEAKAKPKREEMPMKYRDEALGVEFHSELHELRWVNRMRKPVRGLYILRAVATDLRLAKPLHDRAEVYVYRP